MFLIQILVYMKKNFYQKPKNEKKKNKKEIKQKKYSKNKIELI